MKWFKALWRGKKQEIKRSSKEQDRLTDDEQNLIAKQGGCPDCGGSLLAGPSGGMATNYCCARCYSEFNLTFIGHAVIGERISDKGPRNVGDRAWCYGLTKTRPVASGTSHG